MLFWHLHRRLRKKRELNKDNRFEGSHLKTDPPEYDVEVSACLQCRRVVHKYGANAEVKIKPVSKEWEKRSLKMQRNRRDNNFVLYTTSCAGMSPLNKITAN